MKKPKKLLGLFVAAILLVSMFAACEGPEGPAGPKGDPGEQGEPGDNVVNWEGFKEGIKCADCHNPDVDTLYFVWGIRTQWSQSKHANGGAYFENSTTCGPCHTTEGFVEADLGRTPTAHPISSPIGCFACHSPHSRADFSLRTVEPVTMVSNVVGVDNFVFDYGKGNLCANCHKPREMTLPNSPKPDPTKTAETDTIVIKSSRWYSHYGVQGQMLGGEGGFEFQGEVYGNSPHTGSSVIQDEGCVICHMAVEERNPAGGHTMKLKVESEGEEVEMIAGCLTSGCHSEPFELDYDGKQTIIHGLVDSLATLLLDRNWIKQNEDGSYSVKASTSAPLKIAPEYLSGAMFNFFFVEHDLSFGSHNYDYAKKLLEDSIAKLTE